MPAKLRFFTLRIADIFPKTSILAAPLRSVGGQFWFSSNRHGLVAFSSHGNFIAKINLCLYLRLVKDKKPFLAKNPYPRDPPPGNGRPHYISQLSDIGFIGKVYSLMVTSSQI